MPKTTDNIDRVSVWMISIIGVVVFFGGILQLRSHLFAFDRSIAGSLDKIETALQQNDNDAAISDNPSAQELSELQNKDTDSDTLTDFQELYVYGTSPYLPDSDSDTLPDNEELAQGTNPNCVEGAACSQAREEGTGDASSSAAKAFSELNPDEALEQFGVSEDGTVDAQKLREQLKKLGVPADVVDQADDATLLKVFEETVSQTENGANAFVNIADKAEELRNLSAQEKRNLLIEAGVDTGTVQQLSDDQLNELFNKTVDDALSEINKTKELVDGGAAEEGAPSEEGTSTTEEEQ